MGWRDPVNLDTEIEEIKQTLKILDEKVGEISRSIRAYVDFLTEKRLEEGLDEFQQRNDRRFSGLENRIEVLEKSAEGKKLP